MLHIVTHETKSVNGRFPELWATSHQIASSLVSKCVASFLFQEGEVWVWLRRSCGWGHGTNCNAYSSFPQLHNLKFNVKNTLLAVKECLKWILRIHSSCLNVRQLYSAVLVITYICISALGEHDSGSAKDWRSDLWKPEPNYVYGDQNLARIRARNSDNTNTDIERRYQ